MRPDGRPSPNLGFYQSRNPTCLSPPLYSHLLAQDDDDGDGDGDGNGVHENLPELEKRMLGQFYLFVHHRRFEWSQVGLENV